MPIADSALGRFHSGLAGVRADHLVLARGCTASGGEQVTDRVGPGENGDITRRWAHRFGAYVPGKFRWPAGWDGRTVRRAGHCPQRGVAMFAARSSAITVRSLE